MNTCTHVHVRARAHTHIYKSEEKKDRYENGGDMMGKRSSMGVQGTEDKGE